MNEAIIITYTGQARLQAAKEQCFLRLVSYRETTKIVTIIVVMTEPS